MNKLLFVILTAMISQLCLAVSLGDQFNTKIAAQTNTTTSAIKLVDSKAKFSTYVENSNHGQMKILVNNNSNRVYSISWNNDNIINLRDVLGNYYSEFEKAAQHPQMRIPRRAISVDDGNLTVSQFGSMVSGSYGTATIRSLAPQN